MNVYFGSFSLLQDTTKRWKIFSILLDILKIEKIIYFVPNNKYYQLPFSFPKEFQHMILYRYEEDDMEKAIKEAGGTMPEDLPTPDKSLKELEKIGK